MKPTVVHLRADSPFAAIFPAGAPISSPVAERGSFDGEEEDFYRCSFAWSTPEQRMAVARLVARRGGGHAAEVLRDWRELRWLPLRARHVASIQVDGRLLT